MERIEPKESINVLALAGLALSILAFVLALIPCLGSIAVMPAILALVFGTLGLIRADRYQSSKYLAVVAVVLSTTALVIALLWTGLIATVSTNYDHTWQHKLEKKLDKIKKEIKEKEITIELKELELDEKTKRDISVKAEKVGETIEELVTEMLHDIHSVQIETIDNRLIIRIPKESLTEDEIKELEEDLKELEEDLSDLIDDISIQLEFRSKR
jgi:predicted PurR-regulated permease PerM